MHGVRGLIRTGLTGDRPVMMTTKVDGSIIVHSRPSLRLVVFTVLTSYDRFTPSRREPMNVHVISRLFQDHACHDELVNGVFSCLASLHMLSSADAYTDLLSTG